MRGEQGRRGLLARLDAVVEALHHRHVGPVDADLGEAVAQTGQPVALHRVGGVLLARAVGGPVVVPGAQPHAQHPDPAVAQAGEVAGQREHACAVVHPDPVDPLHPVRLVADHDGQRPL